MGGLLTVGKEGEGMSKRKNIGSKLRRKMRRWLILLCGEYPNCHWCGRILHAKGDPNHDGYATVEHLKPRCEGGSNKLENITFACAACNSSRAAKEIKEDVKV